EMKTTITETRNEITQTVSKTLEDQSATIQQIQRVQTDTNNDLAALYMLKVQKTKNGIPYVAGIGAGIEDADGQPLSNILLQADRISMINPENSNTTPLFVAQGNQLFMNDVFLKRLFAVSITSSGEPPTFSLTPDGKLTARNADISGHISANSGTLNNVTIAENCVVKGTISADRIIGDIVKGYSFEPRDGTLHITNHKYGEGYVIFKAEVSLADDVSFDRKLILLPFFFYSGTLTIEINGRVVIKAEPRIADTGFSGRFDRNGNAVNTYTNLGDTVSGVWDVVAGGGDTRITVTMRVEGGPGNMGDVEGRKRELVRWRYDAFTLMVAKSTDSGFTRRS
ncbi:TPA: DUF1983 domain-containing protein, partial [Escherichia coli]|nr:DUF1983 domain-containing protein [Escherichia coli]